MSFSKRPGKNTSQCYTKPLDSLKNWNNRFFWVDERVFPTIVDWRTSAPKDGMPAENTYSPEAVRILDTHRTPIQKQPEALLCLVGLSRRYYLGDEVYPTFLHDDDRDMDLFNFIRAPNPTKKWRTRPQPDSSRVPSTIERSPLDFANENPSQQSTGPEDQETVATEVPPPENVPTIGGAPEAGPAKRVAATDPPAVKERRKRGHDGVDTNAPPKVLRRDHADPRPTESTRGGKSLAAIELEMGSTRPTPAPQGAPADMSDPDPLSFADPQSRPSADVAQSSKGAAVAGDPESENTSFASMVVSPESIYRPKWGITNGSTLDTPEACQDLVDHVAPPGHFSELRHLHNDDFLKQYNVNLARQVAMGSHLRLRFEQEAKLLKKSIAQVARRDKRIQARENEIKNPETLLEAEADMKKAAEGKSVELSQELENMHALFSDLQLYEDNRVEQHCAEMDARLDALSIDFDEELYPHMLTAIIGRTWMIRRGLRLAVMKCDESIELRQAFTNVVSAGIAKGLSEGLKHGVEHGQAKLDLEAIEAYDPEAEAKYITALHALKNLKYPLVDQLEGLKDAPIDVIMASLHLESDTRDDAPQWVRELHPSSSQLTISVYPDVRDPMDLWACKEEILLADAIAANVSRAEKKRKCRVVCRTHGVGSAHHARSDGVPVSAPTVVPRGLAILLADAATQTETSDEASPQLLRSSSLPVRYG
uniref:Putative transposase (Putative), gypsy type n=1 Tax=Tanacetum cinerariifolium TaxID=118510 RepID=A0A699H4Z2_TANCI|nr:putative transposase (putative), gypsy type [Tanacetum cinerariifolium]